MTLITWLDNNSKKYELARKENGENKGNLPNTKLVKLRRKVGTVVTLSLPETGAEGQTSPPQ